MGLRKRDNKHKKVQRAFLEGKNNKNKLIKLAPQLKIKRISSYIPCFFLQCECDWSECFYKKGLKPN